MGGEERFDVLARCFLNLDRWKTRLEHDLELNIFLSHPEEQNVITISLADIPVVLTSELEAVFYLMDVFSQPELYKIKITSMSFEKLIESKLDSCILYYLTPDGVPLQEVSKNFTNNESICFILGSQNDLSQDEENILIKIGVNTISLGKQIYLASHVITIICYHFLS